jgi:hypothetical protein
VPNDTASVPSIVLSCDPPGPLFLISEQAVMPKITVATTLRNIAPDAAIPMQFRWRVSLVFTGESCAHSRGRMIRHPDIDELTASPQFVIPFTQVRGGELSVRVTVTIGGVVQLTAESVGMQIGGVNPSIEALRAAATGASDGFKQLMRLESGLRQFRSPVCPLFSADNLGGVGLCQITSPTPTDDQIWDWQENLKARLTLYRSKETIARGYPAKVRNSAGFRNLLKVYNDRRVTQGVQPVPIDLPEFTPEQLERDTLRGFNGYAGQLHEYRLKLDTDGALLVTVNPTNTKGMAGWERVTPAQRSAYYDKIGLAANRRGDVNYVDDVEAEACF